MAEVAMTKGTSDHESHGALQPVDVCGAPEGSIAVGPAYSAQPVKLMQDLQAHIEAIEAHGTKIVRLDRRALIEDQTGCLQPVVG